tara:strand:+ start:748 stop:969 length:222 start_codon:yes stop_codon:yes gene_type:complete
LVVVEQEHLDLHTVRELLLERILFLIRQELKDVVKLQPLVVDDLVVKVDKDTLVDQVVELVYFQLERPTEVKV